MSGIARKRSSKWDLREESHFKAEGEDHGWPGKNARPGWVSPEGASDSGPKWPAMEANDISKSKQGWGLLSKEPLPGSKASHKDDYTNKSYNRNMEGTNEWDADKSYGTRMSPGLDGWRRQGSNLSDRNDWSRRRSRSHSWSRSRSRSRSPHSFKRDPGYHDDRNRNRSRVSTQLCRDFASGRCRRGSGCPFLHHDNQNLDDSWENRYSKGRPSRSIPQDFRDQPRSGRSAPHCAEFVKGRCHRGASCKFSHDSASHELSRSSSNDIGRDRESDRSKEVYLSRGEREPCSTGVVTCKFFAAGNCRNGKNCKFSHRSQAHASPERKSNADRWEQAQYSDDRERLWNGPKSSDLASGYDVTQLREVINEPIGGREQRYTWSSEKKWSHGLNDEGKTHSEQAVIMKALPGNKSEAFLSKTKDAGGSVGTSETRGIGKWPSDMEMSPDWHYTVQPSNPLVKGEGNSIRDSGSLSSMPLGTLSHGIAQEALAKKKDIAMEPITVETSYLQQNHNLMQDVAIASTLNDTVTLDNPTCSHAEGNSSGNIVHGQRMTYHTDHLGGTVMNQKVADGNITRKPQDTHASVPGNNSGANIAPNKVTNEQITQLTNLSVSLAQYFGNVQPLPQLYAAVNLENSSIPYSDATMGALMASIKSNSVIDCPKQHDPACNSIELKKPEVAKTLSECLPNSMGKNGVTNGKQEIHVGNLPISSDPCSKAGISAEEEPVADGEAIKGKNEDGDKEKKTTQGVNENSIENGTTENVDGNDRVTDKKKSKDAKGIRAFKFALVEFVKELLKPTWKDGHINKDVYKTIVKKVVEKVTGTFQAGHVPQTQEKIDHYLSFSKEKLTKLVQAYVDKVQKT